MAKGDKYIALTTYLKNSGKNVVKMSFKEIESVLGECLPECAYKYPALWANSESHSIAFGWIDAGYMSQNVSITNQTIEFVKRDYVNKETILKPKMKIDVEKEPSLSIDEAIRCIRTYFNETVKDSHGRYLSWCHCYNAFKTYRNNCDENTVDYLALHLAFYLASWGMYRGSSFLLQKDYKVHIAVVEIILEEKYNSLLGITAESLIEEKMLDLLEDVSGRIRQAYAKEQPSFDGFTNNATDTLVTKILLGTLGCVPAYDRFYIQTLREYGISTGGYDRRSVRDVAKYYLRYKDEFEKVRTELNAFGMEYPVMKVMDMCLWQVSYEKDIDEKIKKIYNSYSQHFNGEDLKDDKE